MYQFFHWGYDPGIMGLPMHETAQLLQSFGFRI